MAKITAQPEIKVTIQFNITEAEARALDALVGYGPVSFLKVFKEHMGESYMRGNEDGLNLFFKSIREIIPPILSKTDAARKVFSGKG